MDYEFISNTVKEGSIYWKKIIKDKTYVDIEDKYEDELYCFEDCNRIFEELLIDYLIYLYRPQKKISWTKIGFINEFLGWDCDWELDFKSRIKNRKLHGKEYEKNAPLLLMIVVDYSNALYDNRIYTSKLYPYRMMNVYKALGREFIKCNEDKDDVEANERLDNYLLLMNEYIENNLNNEIVKYIREIYDKTKTIEEMEALMKDFSGNDIKKVRGDKPMKLDALKKEWHEIVKMLDGVTISDWDDPAEELIEYRLLDRLLTYCGKSKMTKHQKDVISAIFTVSNINKLIYQGENELRAILSTISYEGDEATKHLDMEIFTKVDNARYEPGDDSICSKKYFDFFKRLSESFMECSDDISKNKLFKTQVNELEEYAKNNLNASLFEKFFSSKEKSENVTPRENETETVDELINELNSLIGLENVKQEVNSLINLIKIRNMREKMNMKQVPMSMHLVFTGNPGTGKTTVARLLSKIYYKLDILSKGHLTEVDRSGLVAGYVGQTALKVSDVIKESMGGILFIDEAYSLTLNREDSDFGYEAVDTLLKAMEDNRDDLIIIVAGYTEPMESFLESNPGLRSRFNKYILFEDYSPKELIAIFKLFCEKNEYVADDNLINTLTKYFEKIYINRDDTFSNGRLVRNIFEKIISNQADRLATGNTFTRETLRLLTEDDLDGVIE